MTPRLATLVAVILGALAFGSVPVTAAEPKPTATRPRHGGTLRLAAEEDPRSLDVGKVYSRDEAMLSLLLFDTLIETAPDGGFLPALAEALPTTSSDGRTHTFRLRKDIRFTNGKELDAEDVVFSFTRYFDPGSETANSSYFYSITGGLEFLEARKKEATSPAPPGSSKRARWIEPVTVSGLRALDRHTIEIRLNQPDLAFLHVLTSPPGGIVPRPDPREEQPPPRRGFPPAGTGRFRLEDWVRGVRLRFTRNLGHFRANRPTPEAVEVLVNIDRATQGMMFERGELDFLNYVHDADNPRFRRDPHLRNLLHVVPGALPTFVFLNCELPPFTNRLVRIALNHAIDRESMVRALGHRAQVQRGPLPLTVRGFNQNLPEYPYDPDRARALLTEAGYPNGFETTLWTVRSDAHWARIAQLVQESLRKVGVTTHVREVSFAAMLDASGRRRTIPMGVWNWASAFNDPKETLDSLLNGDNLTDEGCMNPSFYSNPAVQALFRAANGEADASRRTDIYRRIEQQVVADAPWIFLVQINFELAMQPWLKGTQPTGFWPACRIENCWLEP